LSSCNMFCAIKNMKLILPVKTIYSTIDTGVVLVGYS
jgi:hypothetical protein